MTPDRLIAVEFTHTHTLIPGDENHICYGTIVYVDTFGKEFSTSWMHRVVRVGDRLLTSGLPGAYSSEWQDK
jgi:hypothetical protein